MDYYMIVLRAVHIVSSTFWAGVAFFIFTSLGPTATSAGPEGGKFMQRLSGPGKMTFYMYLAAVLANVTGFLLYWRVSGTFNPKWIFSGYGLTITIASLAALVALLIGFLVAGKAGREMARVAKEIQANEGPPDPDKLAAMKAHQEKQINGGKMVAIFLLISAVGMAIAQYIWF